MTTASYNSNTRTGSNTGLLLTASSLNGDSVQNIEGENLGDIKDLMIDTGTGKVAYAVLSFGGIMGMGDKLFAVPWTSLQVDTNNKCLTLNVPKERLKNAPGFDKDHWPNFADNSITDQIGTYYQGTEWGDGMDRNSIGRDNVGRQDTARH